MTLLLESDEREAVHWLRYRNAARGGGTMVEHLGIEVARARGLPPGVDAVIATSDLQGVVSHPRTKASTLLGIAVAEALEQLAYDGTLPACARTGVILAGDLYSVPDADQRGGHGDVAGVWSAFASRFAWVAGVAGNHDDVSAVGRADNLHLLDTDQVTIDGLRVAGVGLIAGNPAKRGRRAEDDQLDRIALTAAGAQLLILHEGPSGEGRHQRGHAGIRALVEEHAVPLTICGHDHWDPPLARTAHGQILNVDARVIVLVR